MAFSKHHLYNPIDQITGNYFHALGHGARIQIIKQLISSGPSVVQVLAKDHPIHKESLSDHMRILRNFHLVEWEEKYPYTFYSVDGESLKNAGKYLSEFLEVIKSTE